MVRTEVSSLQNDIDALPYKEEEEPNRILNSGMEKDPRLLEAKNKMKSAN